MSFYKVTQLADGVYRLVSAEAVFEELLVGEKAALLFDTGWGLGPLRETVRELTDKPLIVVNSHGHVDHVNGNSQFEGPVYIHPKDMDLAKAHGSALMRGYILQTVSDGGLLPENFDREAYLAQREIEYVPVEEGRVFDLGGKTLEVVELPGHTLGSIGLLYREGGILYVGDAINGALLLSGPESASVEEYAGTLKKAKKLPFEKMALGHGKELLGKPVLDIYLKVAESADWDRAVPYKDPAKPDAQPSDTVRVMCTEGMSVSLENLQNPDFACIIFTKEKLKKGGEI